MLICRSQLAMSRAFSFLSELSGSHVSPHPQVSTGQERATLYLCELSENHVDPEGGGFGPRTDNPQPDLGVLRQWGTKALDSLDVPILIISYC